MKSISPTERGLFTNRLFFDYWNTVKLYTNATDLGMGMPTPAFFNFDIEKKLAEGIHLQADYQPQAGHRAIRNALAKHESHRIGMLQSPENIMLVAGALRGFSLVTEFLAPNARRFIEVVPTYPLLSGQVRNIVQKYNCELVTVYPKDQDCFHLTSDDIFDAVVENSVIYITNPSNPTGLYHSPFVLQEILERCEQTNSYLIIDETCDIPLTPRNTFATKSSHLIRINSFSKNLLLAGYRSGYIVAHEDLIQTLAFHYSYSDGNAPIVVNDAIVDGLERWQHIINPIVTITRNQLDWVISRLKNIPQVTHFIAPEGCYYMLIKTRFTDGDWVLFERLLARGLNVLPGKLFGIDSKNGSWVRICFARDTGELAQGLEILKQVLANP